MGGVTPRYLLWREFRLVVRASSGDVPRIRRHGATLCVDEGMLACVPRVAKRRACGRADVDDGQGTRASVAGWDARRLVKAGLGKCRLLLPSTGHARVSDHHLTGVLLSLCACSSDPGCVCAHARLLSVLPTNLGPR